MRSVHDAKEISVNFNKKGAGEKTLSENDNMGMHNAIATTAGLCRYMYVFFNAGVQGLQNFSAAARKHPGKFGAMAGLQLALGGFFIPLLNAMLCGGDGDDDEVAKDYWMLSDFVRRQNICIFNGSQGFIKIPLPIELRAIYGLGDIIFGNVSGNNKTPMEKTAHDVVSQVMQIMPLDPITGTSTMQELIPSAFRPVSEWIANEDWTGKPIRRDSPWDNGKTNWQKAFNRTNPMLVEIAKSATEATGNNAYDTNAWLELDPAMIEHFLNGYLGGVFNFANKVGSTAYDLAKGNEVAPYRTPFVSRLYTSVDDRQLTAMLSNYFNGELKDRTDSYKAQLKGLESEIQDARTTHDLMREQELIGQYRKLTSSKDAEVAHIYNLASREMRLYKKYKLQGFDVDADIAVLLKAVRDRVSAIEKGKDDD